MGGLERPSIANVRDRLNQCVMGMFMHDQKFEWSSGNLIYIGMHRLHPASDTEPEWAIWKLTWDASSNLTRMEGPLEGTWDTRAALGWG